MDRNAGLVRCNEELGHHDAYLHAWGYLKGALNAEGLATMIDAMESAERAGYIVPRDMELSQRWVALVADDAESPF